MSSRPRQAAPPRVAISSASRACIAPAPPRSRASSSAPRVSSHSDAQSADAEPSQPIPTGTPASRSSRTGARPAPRIWFELGQCATPVPQRPNRSISAWLGFTQCATQARAEPQPTRSKYSTGRQPNAASQNRSSSRSSAKWVCRRTSSRSASSAVRRISSGVTENGEHGASATRTIAPGAGSWCNATNRSESARISSSSCTTSSGGRPPSFTDRLIDPRVGWKRKPSSRAASISAPIRSPAPRGWRYR